MKILHFTDTFYPFLNGVTIAVDIYGRVMSRSDDVVIYCPAESIRSQTKTSGRLTIKCISSVRFPIYPGVRVAITNIIKLYREVRDQKPDIIHIHTPFLLGILGTLFAKILNVKIVSTYHTLFTTQLIYVDPYKKLKTAIKGAADSQEDETGILARITWVLQIVFFNLADLVIAPTKSIKKILREHGLKPRIIVLPTGLDTQKFPCKTSFTPTKKILYFGRLGLEKSLDILVKAFAIFVKDNPEYHLVIGGDGPARAHLEKLSQKLHIQDSITFLGEIPTEETPPVFRDADFFVNPSAMETQSIVILEAMLSGQPVIATAKYAPIDLIKAGKTGYLFKESNVSECVTYMKKLIRNNECEKLGRNAREFALQFDQELFVAELLAHYKKLLGRR